MKYGLRIVLLSCLMALAGTMDGQAPGFLGKRTLLGGGIYFSPRNALDLDCLPNWAGNYKCFWDKRGGIGFNLTGSLSWEKAMSRTVILGLSGEVTGLGGFGEFYNGQNYEERTTRLLHVGLGIGTKHHSFLFRGAIAPYGGYFSTMFRVSSVTEHLAGRGNMFYSSNTLGYYISPAFYLGLGYHIYATDNLIVDIGMRAGVDYPIPIHNDRRYPGSAAFFVLSPQAFKFYAKVFWLK